MEVDIQVPVSQCLYLTDRRSTCYKVTRKSGQIGPFVVVQAKAEDENNMWDQR